jgi:deazaflavin-dependent oxidoreductase (nitroreductase family)
VDAGNHVIVASKGGAPTNPAWYHNLRTHPIVTVEVHGEKFKARAKVVDGEDYERLFQQHAKKMPGFNDYRQKTTRKLPVIVLERLDSEDAA